MSDEGKPKNGVSLNGVNGTNGKKPDVDDGGVFANIGDIGANTDAPYGFKATVRQGVFRQVAVKLSREGLFLAQDWIRHCNNEPGMPRIRWGEWQGWKKIAGFNEWFFAPLLDPCEIDERDMQLLEMLYWNAVRNGMLRNESWAVKEFATRRWTKGADTMSAKDAEADLAAWLGQVGSNAWKAKPAEA